MSDTARRSGFMSALVRRLRHAPAEEIDAVGPTAEDERVTIFLAALQEMSAKMKAEMPLPDLLALLAEQATIAIDSDVALIRLVDRDGNGLVVQGVYGVAVHRVAGLLGSFSVITDTFRSLWPGSLASFDLSAGVPPLLTAGEYTELEELGSVQLLVLPLHHRGKLVGRLDLARQRDEPYSVDDRAASTVLAGLMASALCNPVTAAESEAAQVLEASFSFQRSTEQLSSAAETLQSIVESVRGTTNCDRCYGLLWQEPKRQFAPVAVSGVEPHLLPALKSLSFSPAVVPALAQALGGPEPVVIEDAERGSSLPPAMSKALDIRAAVIVPLRGREERLLGALMLGYTHTHGSEQIAERELTIVRNMAAHAAIVLENALLYEDVKRTSDSLALVNEIGIELASLTDLNRLFSQVYQRVGTMIAAPRFCVGLLLPDGESIEYRYAVHEQIAETPAVVSLADDPLSWVVKTQKRILVNARHPQDHGTWFRADPGLPPAQSMLAVPMLVGHRVIGVMSAQNDARGAYAQHQLDLLATIGVQTGVAIENARLLTMLQEQGELRGYLLDQMLNRQEAERKMLVDDIHNDTLQALATCLFRIDLTSRRVTQTPPEETQRELLEVREDLAENIARLRHLIFQIRPSTLDILGLPAALQEYFKQLEKDTGIKTTLDVEMSSRLESDLETGIYRIIQEAIDHIRMRDSITRIVIRIRQRQDSVVVTIADDGRGLDAAVLTTPLLVHAGGVGAAGPATTIQGEPEPPGMADAKVSLLTLKERAEMAGGEVRLASRSGGGSTIQIVLPNRSVT